MYVFVFASISLLYSEGHMCSYRTLHLWRYKTVCPKGLNASFSVSKFMSHAIFLGMAKAEGISPAKRFVTWDLVGTEDAKLHLVSFSCILSYKCSWCRLLGNHRKPWTTDVIIETGTVVYYRLIATRFSFFSGNS